MASWQKITHPTAPYKIYIEGDGHAFNAHGQPTGNPTPKGTLVRELAFGDNHENVIYLARPCQYV
ncbi:MAG: alpha/beta hydrolase, partial [bacterium]|nr:alpha/beta hydrolase [bacterium]